MNMAAKSSGATIAARGADQSGCCCAAASARLPAACTVSNLEGALMFSLIAYLQELFGIGGAATDHGVGSPEYGG